MLEHAIKNVKIPQVEVMIINSILLFGAMNLMEILLMRVNGILRLEMETGDGEMENTNTIDKKMRPLKMENLS